MAISESPISSTPISSSAPSAAVPGLPGIRSTRAKPPPPPILNGKVTRRGADVAEDPGGLPIPGFRFIPSKPPHPDQLKGTAIQRLVGQDPIELPVPLLRIVRPVYPNPDVLKGTSTNTGRRGAMADPLALPVPKIRVVRPVYPNPDVLEGSSKRQEQKDLLLFFTPLQVTKQRLSRPVYPNVDVLKGNVSRWQPDHLDPPNLPVPKIKIDHPIHLSIPPDILEGVVIRHGVKNPEVPLPVPRLRLIPSKPPHPDQLKGGILRRGASIAEDPLNLPVPIIRIVRPIYPNPDVLKGFSIRRDGFEVSEDPVNLPVPMIRIVRPVYPAPDVLKGRFRRFPGQEPFLTFDIHEQPFVQNYRVADDDFSRFELYVGEDQLPDLKTEPILVSQTLPFSLPITPPVSGTKTIFVVLRERDEHGVISANQQTTIFVIDSTGALEFAPPGPAVQLQLFPDAIGKALVFLRYNKAADGLNPADIWEVFASEGVDPDPTVDVPVHTSTIVDFGELAYLRTVIESFTPGSTLHVIGSVFRSSDGKRGVTPVETIVLPLAPSIDEDKTTTFGGEVHEIR